MCLSKVNRGIILSSEIKRILDNIVNSVKIFHLSHFCIFVAFYMHQIKRFTIRDFSIPDRSIVFARYSARCRNSLRQSLPYANSREAPEYAIATHERSPWRIRGSALIHGALKNSWKYQSLSIRQRSWLRAARLASKYPRYVADARKREDGMHASRCKSRKACV